MLGLLEAIGTALAILAFLGFCGFVFISLNNKYRGINKDLVETSEPRNEYTCVFNFNGDIRKEVIKANSKADAKLKFMAQYSGIDLVALVKK